MTLKHKIGSIIAVGAMYAAMATPALAATNVDVTGNGVFSDNTVKVKKSSSKTVFQTNVTNVKNNVGTKQNTGKNSASFNTGGSNSINTGSATSNVTITNVSGGNVNNNDCGCPEEDVDVTVSDNGFKSDNTVKVKMTNHDFVSQFNSTRFRNDVWTEQNTGKNSASFNTGDSTQTIGTGPTDSTVEVGNMSGENVNGEATP